MINIVRTDLGSLEPSLFEHSYCLLVQLKKIFYCCCLLFNYGLEVLHLSQRPSLSVDGWYMMAI